MDPLPTDPRFIARTLDRVRALPRTYQALGVLIAAVIVIVGATAAFQLLVPPSNFPTGQVIEVPADVSVGEMGFALRSAGVIRSTLVFKAYTRLTLQDRSLSSGLYVFDRPLGLAHLVYRMNRGYHGITEARVTLTEGMTVNDMAGVLETQIPGFDTETFLNQASTSEGYLFPDTYFFMPSTTPDDVILRLRSRFDERVASITPDVIASGRSLEDIVIMASILEREAQGLEDKRIVAGILWKRLDAGMRLQVDAPFGYIRGVNGYTPTATDLATDSPYNTYLNEGLTPGPIANPGLESLYAAAVPTISDYLYYLTGRDGLMHYGVDFEDHKRNRALYLD